MSVISLQKVVKSFKGFVAVKGLSFDLNPGECVALLGPNGAGKTTLLEMIEGLQEPSSGKIQLFGLTWVEHESIIRRRIGICLQETQFMDKLTVLETLKLFASFYDLSIERVEEVIRNMRLEEKKNTYATELSGGQRQRLALALALLNRPELILLDEPTTGLDPSSRKEIWDLLKECKKNGLSMVLTTHYMEEASSLCERILMIDQGRFIAQGTLEDLQKQYFQGSLEEIFLHLTGRGLE